MVGRSTDSGEELLRRMVARRRRDNVIVAVLAVLAVFGGGHAILDMFAADPSAPTDNATPSTIGRAQLAGSFAEQFVVTYLGSVAGQQDRIGEYVSGNAQQISLPTTVRQVSDPVVVYLAREVAADTLEVWSVTVSVRVNRTTGTTGTTGTADTRQYYRVAVSVLDGRLRALSLPAVVEPPSRGADLSTAYATPCSADTPLSQVASGFLAAFLTGSGDVSRYITLDAGIAALHPAPFASVETVTVTSTDSTCGAAQSSAQVLATVNPKGDGGAAATLAYPLTMVRGGGQWQVRSVDPVPTLSNPLAVVANQDSRESAAGAVTMAPSTTAQVPRATQN